MEYELHPGCVRVYEGVGNPEYRSVVFYHDPNHDHASYVKYEVGVLSYRTASDAYDAAERSIVNVMRERAAKKQKIADAAPELIEMLKNARTALEKYGGLTMVIEIEKVLKPLIGDE